MWSLISFLLLLSPVFCREDCASELQRETEEDRRTHECRACTEITTDEINCPAFGYECDEELTLKTEVPSADNCHCISARCLSKLFEKGTKLNQLRCENRTWIGADGDKAETVVCGKDCDIRVCARSHPNNLPEFLPLEVTKATTESKCATATCKQGELTTLKEDGTVESSLSGELITCTGDGKRIDQGGNKYQYVMCNTLCGCPDLPEVPCGWGRNCVRLLRNGCGYSCPANWQLYFYKTKDQEEFSNPGAQLICRGTTYEGPRGYLGGGAGCYPKDDTNAFRSLPSDSSCQALTEETYTNAIPTDFSYIRYVKDGDDYYVTCDIGSIASKGLSPIHPLTIRCVDGQWDQSITKATCITDSKVAMTSCLSKGNTAGVNVACHKGICRFYCDGSDKLRFSAMDGTVTETDRLACDSGVPTRLNGERILNDEFECVPP